jgi:hypothetical protein
MRQSVALFNRVTLFNSVRERPNWVKGVTNTVSKTPAMRVSPPLPKLESPFNPFPIGA